MHLLSCICAEGLICFAFNRVRVRRLESKIDKLIASLPDLTSFVLPGGSKRSAALHVCRCVYIPIRLLCASILMCSSVKVYHKASGAHTNATGTATRTRAARRY